MKIVAKTDQGKVRKDNQDSFAAGELPGGVVWAVVCDGMGGAKSGNVASSLAVDVFVQEVTRNWTSQTDWDKCDMILRSAVKLANFTVYDQACQFEEFSGMGTTLVAAVIRKNQASIINVGDSRCYYLSEGEVSQVTEDHSVVGLMVARGQISEEEARNHPNKNLITRAVGTEPQVECDCFYLGLDHGEYLLLCSDGLSNLVSRPEMLFEITHNEDLSECCQRLIDIAKTRGAPDNVTLVLIAY